MRPTRYQIQEWERHSDLLTYEPTAAYTVLAAAAVTYMAAEHFRFPAPNVCCNKRATMISTCTMTEDHDHCLITMRGSFTAGELLHELAHAWMFARFVDHSHDMAFALRMDELCDWFRQSETAQKYLFP